VIVTISREYGAAGRAVTHALAERLDYRILDEELAVVVAARLGTSPDVVDGTEVRPSGFTHRLLRSFAAAAIPEAMQPHEEVDDLALAVQREVERHMHAAADGDDVIVVGRLGNHVLRARSNVLRVFLVAALPWRVEHIRESLGCSEAQARAEIARVDNGRRDSARERYGFTFGDPHEYDLVVDVGRFGVAGAVDVIAAAHRARA
jgi:cytidylate kinase